MSRGPRNAPAIVMAGSGEVVTYAQLEERSIRFAHGAARTRAAGRRPHRDPDGEQPPLSRGAWAAQRSGLYYTAVNRHLHSARCSTSSTTAAPTALVASRRWPTSSQGWTCRGSARGSARWATCRVSRTTKTLLDTSSTAAAAPTSARAGRCCTRREQLGGPRGCASRCPRTPLGDPTSAPVQIARACWRQRGRRRSGVPVARAALSRAPLVLSMSLHRLGGTVS